jgi:hypothetical protein
MSANRPGHLPPDKLEMLIELLPVAESFRDIALLLDLRPDRVRVEAAPFLLLMKLDGTHPECGCGRDRYHQYGCADAYQKGKRADGMPGHSPERAVVLLERRAAALEMIKAGVRWCEINDALGTSRNYAEHYLRYLSPEEREVRKQLDRARRDELRRAPLRRPRRSPQRRADVLEQSKRPLTGAVSL